MRYGRGRGALGVMPGQVLGGGRGVMRRLVHVQEMVGPAPFATSGRPAPQYPRQPQRQQHDAPGVEQKRRRVAETRDGGTDQQCAEALPKEQQAGENRDCLGPRLRRTCP